MPIAVDAYALGSVMVLVAEASPAVAIVHTIDSPAARIAGRRLRRIVHQGHRREVPLAAESCVKSTARTWDEYAPEPRGEPFKR